MQTKGTQVQVVMPTRKGGPAAIISSDAAPKPEMAGVKRNAEMWGRVVFWSCILPAIVLTAFSALLLADLASDLASTWAGTLRLTGPAIALALAGGGLPAIAGYLQDTRPGEAAAMMRCWRTMMWLAPLPILFMVFNSVPAAPPISTRAQELRAALAQPLQPAEWEAWSASSSCQAPSARHRAICQAIKTRRDAQWAEVERLEAGGGDWSPVEWIGTGRIRSGLGHYAAAALSGALALIAMLFAGPVARWGLLALEDANRRADGIMPEPVMPDSYAAVSASPGAGVPSSPASTAEVWFKSRVHLDADGRLSPTTAYEDYAENMRANGLVPMPMQAFFNLLAAKAKALGVQRVKSHGAHVYAGWVMAGEMDFGAVTSEPALLPYD
jgi:hypothetical protein